MVVFDCLIPDFDMTSWADDFCCIAGPRFGEPILQTCMSGPISMRYRDWRGGQLIDDHLGEIGKWESPACCSSEVLCDPFHILVPLSDCQVRVCNEVAPLNRCSEILGVTWHTHFNFGFSRPHLHSIEGPHWPVSPNCVELGYLKRDACWNVQRPLYGSSSTTLSLFAILCILFDCR